MTNKTLRINKGIAIALMLTSCTMGKEQASSSLLTTASSDFETIETEDSLKAIPNNLVVNDAQNTFNPFTPFTRGDANQDGTVDISDAQSLLAYLFQGGPEPWGGEVPSCNDVGDVNDDGVINISDPAYLLAFLFRGGPAPAAPFLRPGFDPTEDNLTCELNCTYAVPCSGNYDVESSSDLKEVVQCSRITAGVTFHQIDSLTSINLPCLESAEYLEIYNNEALTRIDLPKLESLTWDLVIEANYRLTEVNLAKLTSPGQIFIVANDDLANLNLPELESVAEELHIEYNYSLTRINLANLESVGGELRILDAYEALTTLTLPNLTSVGSNLRIMGNASLDNLTMPNLTSVGASLEVWNNLALANMYIPSLTSTPRELIILDNPRLDTLTMPSLTSVGTDLTIQNNPRLTTLDGLSNLESVGETLTITNNATLCQTGVTALVNAITVEGPRYYLRNDHGC